MRIACLVILTAAAAIAACDSPEDTTGSPNRYALTLATDPTSVTGAVGDTVSVSAFVIANGKDTVSNATVRFSSSDKTIVDPDAGDFALKKAGTATVTATFQDVNNGQTLTQTVPVTVTP